MPARPASRAARSNDDALAGTTVVVTRPAGTARSLLTAIRRHGGTALTLPGLALRAPDDAAVAARALLAACDADGWIFVSPAAVRFAFRLWPALRLGRHATAFGVGAGTLRALARHGIRSVAPYTRSDSEGLLALPQLAAVQGRRFVLVGAPGGRDLIAPTLRARGARVEPIHVYARGRPRLTRRHFAALAAAADPVVTLLSSGEALEHLVALLPPAVLERLRHGSLVVSSTRLAAAAQGHGFGSVHVAASAASADLLAAAAAVPGRHPA